MAQPHRRVVRTFAVYQVRDPSSSSALLPRVSPAGEGLEDDGDDRMSALHSIDARLEAGVPAVQVAGCDRLVERADAPPLLVEEVLVSAPRGEDPDRVGALMGAVLVLVLVDFAAVCGPLTGCVRSNEIGAGASDVDEPTSGVVDGEDLDRLRGVGAARERAVEALITGDEVSGAIATLDAQSERGEVVRNDPSGATGTGEADEESLATGVSSRPEFDERFGGGAAPDVAEPEPRDAAVQHVRVVVVEIGRASCRE